MSATVHWSGMTHPGRFRKSNEDAFLGMILYPQEAHYLGKEGEHPLEDNEFIFAVSDGMGGANAGEFASKRALEQVSSKILQALSGTPLSIEAKKCFLETMVLSIHDQIVKVGRYYEECKGMGATLSAVWIGSDNAVFVHIGDSRIYHIAKDQAIVQVSEDHSHVGRLHREGKINERQAKSHPERHILDQALGGSGKLIVPQVGSIAFAKGDHLILCSDGICDGLYNRGIQTTIIKPPFNLEKYRPSERLIKEAMYSSGRDNLTAVVIEHSPG